MVAMAVAQWPATALFNDCAALGVFMPEADTSSSSALHSSQSLGWPLLSKRRPAEPFSRMAWRHGAVVSLVAARAAAFQRLRAEGFFSGPLP